MVTTANGADLSTFLLPSGMRDLLPDEARSRRSLARVVLDHVALSGYELVTLPAFEIAEVLERGLGTLDPRDVLRFIEPESGEVAALRPDMTPQIARMAAMRLRELPPPIRLAYEGTVLRRRQERARRHRQIPQAGLELLGVAGPEGDRELLLLAASSVRAAGVERFLLDVGHADIVRQLLEPYGPTRSSAIRDALSVKDAGRVEKLAQASDVPSKVALATAALPTLHGDASVLDRARSLFRGTKAQHALETLSLVIDDHVKSELGNVLSFDLGEVRGFAYYTGLLFHILADGPGEPIGGGGRYDELLGRFGAPMPAAGFALDLDHLAWARRVSGIEETQPLRIALAANPRALAVAAALRSRGITAAIAAGDATDFARSRGYTASLSLTEASWSLTGVATAYTVTEASSLDDDAVAAWAEAFVRDARASLGEVRTRGAQAPAP